MKTKIITHRHALVKTMSAFFMMLFFALGTQTTQAQTTTGQEGERTVSGIVETPAGPLAWASISLKDTYIGVQADEHGAFVFPQPLKENDVLIISSLAYQDQEFTITGETTFIRPLLQGKEITIYAALRSKPTAVSKTKD